MGLRDVFARIRSYVLASFVPASDHPARGGMTGTREEPEADESPPPDESSDRDVDDE